MSDSSPSSSSSSSSPTVPGWFYEEKPGLHAQDAHYDKLQNQELALNEHIKEHQDNLEKISNDDSLTSAEKMLQIEQATIESNEFFASIEENLNQESEELEIPSPNSDDLAYNNDSISEYEVEQRILFEREYNNQLIKAKQEIEQQTSITKEVLANQDADMASSNKRDLDEATPEQGPSKRFKQDSSDVSPTEYDSSDYYED